MDQSDISHHQPNNTLLVGALEHLYILSILGIIIPTDELIFFRGAGIPPFIFFRGIEATNQFKLQFSCAFRRVAVCGCDIGMDIAADGRRQVGQKAKERRGL